MTSQEFCLLTPFLYREVIPSDYMRGSTNALIRTVPLVTPTMHKIDIYLGFYYIPYRLLSNDFRTMVTKPLEDVKIPSLYDYLKKDTYELQSNDLLSAFGISSETGTLSKDALQSISMLPFFAYYLVYNYFFLDPVINADIYKDDLDPSELMSVANLHLPRYVNKYRDYFTSAKPTTQYDEELSLDLNKDGTVKVSEMRLAERLQVWYEKLLHNFEHKYNQTIRGLYGVAPTDESLQRPLYLGGGKQMLNVTDVDSTGNFADVAGFNLPLGTPAGKSLSQTFDNTWKISVTEHGLILGLSWILPRQTYISGIPRVFQRLTSSDFHNPLFNNIGFQEIGNNELDANRTGTFGYVDRYRELKTERDVIANDLIKDNLWHMAENIHDSRLNSEFLRAIPKNHIFAVSKSNASVVNPRAPMRIYLKALTDEHGEIVLLNVSANQNNEDYKIPSDYEHASGFHQIDVTRFIDFGLLINSNVDYYDHLFVNNGRLVGNTPKLPRGFFDEILSPNGLTLEPSMFIEAIFSDKSGNISKSFLSDSSDFEGFQMLPSLSDDTSGSFGSFLLRYMTDNEYIDYFFELDPPFNKVDPNYPIDHLTMPIIGCYYNEVTALRPLPDIVDTKYY